MTSKFQAELDARRAKAEAESSNQRSSIGDELIAIYGRGDGTPPNWYGKAQTTGEKKDAPKPTPPPQLAQYASLIPDVTTFERTDADDALDQIVAHLPITQAYRRWIPKGLPEIKYDGQVESIMIRCPFPNHVDSNPSAWCNTQKNVWFCIACDYGGDIFDLAAIHFGYPVPAYKKNGQFPKLRQQMAADFGIQVVRGVNGKEYTVQNSTTPQPDQTHGVTASIPTQNGSAGPRGPVKIPGLVDISMPMLGQVTQASSPPVTPPPPPPPPPAAPQAKMPPVVVPPVAHQFTPVPTVVTPAAQKEPAPIQTDPAPEPVAPPIPQALQQPAPQQPAPPVPQSPSLIPGLAPVTLGAPGSAFTGTVLSQTPPQTLAPNIVMPRIQVFEPDVETLGEYGLDENGEEDGSSGFTGIELPWRSITPENTFLDKYMALTTQDDSPEEFHYFSALIALSLAAGKDVRLFDRRPVKSNIFVCLLGKTGEGKSNAESYVNDLLSKALPYDGSDPVNNGVNKVTNPGSSEFMVKQFMKQIKDLNNPSLPAELMPVRGLIQFRELATLMKRSNSPSSTLAQFLIEFYDSGYEIKTGSLTHGGFVARDAFASTMSTTQPKALRGIVNQEHVDSGFLNRWIFATGRPKESEPIGGEVLEIDSLIQPLQKVFGWAGTVRQVINWEPAAFNLAVEYLKGEILPIKKADDTDLYARIDLLFKKMILLNTINLNRLSVPAVAVEWAMTSQRYLMETYGSLDKAVHHGLDEELRKAVNKAILAITVKTKRPPSMKQLVDKIGTRKFTGEQILRCVQTLEKIGSITELPPEPGPGRKAVRYQLTSN